jgi:hypothetical protein
MSLSKRVFGLAVLSIGLGLVLAATPALAQNFGGQKGAKVAGMGPLLQKAQGQHGGQGQMGQVQMGQVQIGHGPGAFIQQEIAFLQNLLQQLQAGNLTSEQLQAALQQRITMLQPLQQQAQNAQAGTQNGQADGGRFGVMKAKK